MPTLFGGGCQFITCQFVEWLNQYFPITKSWPSRKQMYMSNESMHMSFEKCEHKHGMNEVRSKHLAHKPKHMIIVTSKVSVNECYMSFEMILQVFSVLNTSMLHAYTLYAICSIDRKFWTWTSKSISVLMVYQLNSEQGSFQLASVYEKNLKLRRLFQHFRFQHQRACH